MRRTTVLLIVAALTAVTMALTAGPAVAQGSSIGNSDNKSGEITTDNSFSSEGSEGSSSWLPYSSWSDSSWYSW
jgi:hypothetical protein